MVDRCERAAARLGGGFFVSWVAVVMFAMVMGCGESHPTAVCSVHVIEIETMISSETNKTDLLFVIDDSPSMAEEQASLRDQFPKLIRRLVTGEMLHTDGSIRATFPAHDDLRIAVVSTDMGLVGGPGVAGCDDGLGKDGRMLVASGCGLAADASFLEFLPGEVGERGEILVDEFACISVLGTAGCGLEQPLEAALKALWPATDIDHITGSQWIDPDTGEPGNRVTFLPDAMGDGRSGHGDGANDMFLRSDHATEHFGGTRLGASLIGIIVVTDEDDCSSSDNSALRSADLPNGAVDPPCLHDERTLYSVERYISGLRLLRQGRENLVVFAVVAGVPPDLVELRDANGNPKIDLTDNVARQSWYDRIVADPRMAERNEGGQRVPSCDTRSGVAYPPHRLIEVARGFGGNGVVQSICDPDFSGILGSLIEIIARQVGEVCFPRALLPDADGRVQCEVVWELPTPEFAHIGVPTECSGAEFLGAPKPGTPTVGEHGGNLCIVHQLAVPPDQRQSAKAAFDEATTTMIVDRVRNSGEGWYYDDFSVEQRARCPISRPQRIAYTDAARPPPGTTVIEKCVVPISSDLEYPDRDQVFYEFIRPAQIGDGCVSIPAINYDSGFTEVRYYDSLIKGDEPTWEEVFGVGVWAQTCDDDAGVCTSDNEGGQPLARDAVCRVKNTDSLDDRMFCHPRTLRCVRGCKQDDDCPGDMLCDDDAATIKATGGRATCIEPACKE